MGCIMTPIPNHLSTYLYYYISLPLNHKPLIKEWGKEGKSSVGKVEVMRRDERCGYGEVE